MEQDAASPLPNVDNKPAEEKKEGDPENEDEEQPKQLYERY